MDEPSPARDGYGPVRHLPAWIIISILAAYAVGLTFAGPRAWSGRQTFVAPRDNVGFATAEHLAKGKGLAIPARHSDELPHDIARALTPWDSANVDGKIVPQDFAGTIVFYAAVLWLWRPLALVVSPLLAALSALLLAQLSAELFASRTPAERPSWRRPRSQREVWVTMSAMALWLAHPGVIIHGSRIFTSDMPALVLLLGAAIFFIRYWKSNRTADFAWLVLLLGTAVFFRYPNALLAAALVVALAIMRRLPVRRVLFGLILFLPFAFAIGLFNRSVYGNFLTTGYELTSRLRAETVNLVGQGLFSIMPEVILNHFRFYVMERPAMLAPALIGLGFAIHLRKKIEVSLGVLISLVAASLIYAAYHFRLATWGSAGATVDASLIRYILPSIALSIWLFAWSMHHVFRDRPHRSALVVGAIVVVSVVTAVLPYGGILDTADELRANGQLRRRVLAVAEPDALILTRVSDWVIFPDRQTVTLSYLIKDAPPTQKTVSQRTWDFMPSPQRLADVCELILAKGIPLYLVGDFFSDFLPAYEDALGSRGLTLELLPTRLGGPRLFRVAAIVSPRAVNISAEEAPHVAASARRESGMRSD